MGGGAIDSVGVCVIKSVVGRGGGVLSKCICYGGGVGVQEWAWGVLLRGY